MHTSGAAAKGWLQSGPSSGLPSAGAAKPGAPAAHGAGTLGTCHSLHAGAGQGVQHGADGGLVARQRHAAVLHIHLRASSERARRLQVPQARRLRHRRLELETRAAAPAGGGTRRSVRSAAARAPPRARTGLRVNRMSEPPRMDQREMWCSGYLRSARDPEASRMLKPSRPTCRTGPLRVAAGVVGARETAAGGGRPALAASPTRSNSSLQLSTSDAESGSVQQGPAVPCTEAKQHRPEHAAPYLGHHALARAAALLGQQPHVETLARHDLCLLNQTAAQCRPARGGQGKRLSVGHSGRRRRRRSALAVGGCGAPRHHRRPARLRLAGLRPSR